MAVPDFQQMMLPILTLAEDGQEHSLREAAEHVAKHFALTPNDRAALLPSGRQTQLLNRAGWVTTYFRKTGILEQTRRGAFRITARGRALLAEHPSKIDNRTLARYPEFHEFHRRGQTEPPAAAAGTAVAVAEAALSPEESFERSFDQLEKTVIQDILEAVRSCSAGRFEQIVVRLLVAMGYGGTLADAGEVLGRSGDEGIDGVIKQDRLGLDRIYIQAKRWQGSVGRPLVQGFSGALTGKGAQRGVMITTSTFTADARQFTENLGNQRIVLVDGPAMARLMLDFRVGVTEVASYAVTWVDHDFFADGA